MVFVITISFLGAVYMRRAGLYFAFRWRASPSRGARHVGANDSNPIVLH